MIQNRPFIVRLTLATVVSLAAFSVASTDNRYSDAKPRPMLGPGDLKVRVHRAHWREIEARRAMPKVWGWNQIPKSAGTSER